MTPRLKKFLSLVLIIIIIIGIGIGIYLLFFTDKDTALHVRRTSVQEIVNQQPENFKSSHLQIYPNGTFEIELVQTIGDKGETLFIGVGVYEKTKAQYTFTYTDSYARIGTTLDQRKDELTQELIPITEVLAIEKNGHIRFDSPWGISYYFGR